MSYDLHGAPYDVHKVLRGVVRFEHGSGFFVSDNGLILTNYHVLEYDLPDEGLKHIGFCANHREEELALPGVYIRELVEQRVESLAQRPEVFYDSDERRAFLAPFRMEWQNSEWGWTLDAAQRVITLFRYRHLNDVRLVMLPSQALATLGSSHRQTLYSFDFAFVRVYDDGRPLSTHYHLCGKLGLPDEGQTAICVGFPRFSCRPSTPQGLEYLRSAELPARIDTLQSITSAAAAKTFRSSASRAFIDQSHTDLLFLTTLQHHLEGWTDQYLGLSKFSPPINQLANLYRDAANDQCFRFYDQRYSNLLRDFIAVGRMPAQRTAIKFSDVDVEDEINFLEIGLHELKQSCGSADPYLYGLQVFSGTNESMNVAKRIVRKLHRVMQGDRYMLPDEWIKLVDDFEPARQVRRQVMHKHDMRRKAILKLETEWILSLSAYTPPPHADGHQRVAVGHRVLLGRNRALDVNALCSHKPVNTLPEGIRTVDRDTCVLYAHDCDVVKGFSGAPTLDETGKVRGLLIGGNVYSRFGEYIEPPKSAFGISLTLDAIWGVLEDNTSMVWLREELWDFMSFHHE